MKNRLNRILLTVAILGMTGMPLIVGAQTPPSPPSHGAAGNQGKGGGAPLDGGLAVSLALVAGYGAWKTFRKNREK